MRRRAFMANLSSALLLPTLLPKNALGQDPRAGLLNPAHLDPGMDMDPCSGYTTRPEKQFFFTDLRHIDPGDLSWRSIDGKPVPVAGPPEPPFEVQADLGRVPRGIRMVAQKAIKEGPLPQGLPLVMIYDEGVYRGWDLDANYPKGKNLGSYSVALPASIGITYFESDNAIDWKVKGKTDVPVDNRTGIDGATFFIDPHGPADERYKALYNCSLPRENKALIAKFQAQYFKLHPHLRDTRLSVENENMSCLYGLVSPDGISWKPIDEPLMMHHGDTHNMIYFDEWLGQYVLYTRLYWLRRRMIARAVSNDFRHWSPVRPIVMPSLDDPFSTDVYTNCRTTFPGAPNYHLMFPTFYHRYSQTSEIRLLSSFDGEIWDQVPGDPVVEAGGPDHWTGEYIGVLGNMVPLGGERMALRLAAASHPHKYPRWKDFIKNRTGWATWPNGRLSALVADEEGEFHTFGLTVTGRELRVNARVWRAGDLRVGIQGNENRTVELCDPIHGDSGTHVVTWKGDPLLGKSEGDTVVLHFKLRSAELFGFEFV